MHQSSLRFCLHIASFSVSVFLCLKSPSPFFYKDTGVGFRVHPKSTMISSQILNYSCKDPISKYGHISYQGLGLGQVFLGRHNSTHYSSIPDLLPKQALSNVLA